MIQSATPAPPPHCEAATRFPRTLTGRSTDSTTASTLWQILFAIAAFALVIGGLL